MAMMEILLRDDVENLGARGEVVKVRAGYGRNYLLPRGLAVQATPSNVKQIEMQRRALLKKAAADKSSAEGQASLLNNVTLTFDRKVGEHGILFGSVTSMDIAEALGQQGYEVDRKRITLAEPIKETGEFEVPVKLHREVTATLKVVVRKEGGGQGGGEEAAQ
jgi:large subunit ribosomal protein L9